jgi:hypothetical protein
MVKTYCRARSQGHIVSSVCSGWSRQSRGNEMGKIDELSDDTILETLITNGSNLKFKRLQIGIQGSRRISKPSHKTYTWQSFRTHCRRSIDDCRCKLQWSSNEVMKAVLQGARCSGQCIVEPDAVFEADWCGRNSTARSLIMSTHRPQRCPRSRSTCTSWITSKPTDANESWDVIRYAGLIWSRMCRGINFVLLKYSIKIAKKCFTISFSLQLLSLSHECLHAWIS